MAQLHYLSVQDILWINLQTTKKVQHYNFARLEEATFYQYAYGESNNLLSQAGRFLAGFLRMQPFDAGNEPTAFVATLAFLKLNGKSLLLRDDDAPAWFEGVRSQQVKGQAAVTSIAMDGDGHDEVSVRDAITTVLQTYGCTVESLLPESIPA